VDNETKWLLIGVLIGALGAVATVLPLACAAGKI
jgi:hypothetical protein